MTALRGGPSELREAVIVVCTFKRVLMLRPLVLAIMEQIVGLRDEFRVRLVVIDNDPEGSALDELASISRRYDNTRFSYLHEDKPGVGNARNLAFTLVRDNEWLIFFDDDQIPGESWLSELLCAGLSGRGDLYVGPVRPSLPEDCPDWAEGGWAWARAEFRDGESRNHAGFGNIMISPTVLSDPSCQVKDDFLNGPGEDTSVTCELVAKGYRIVHVLGASATEPVPVERLNMPWVLARHRNAGRVWARLQLDSRRRTIRLGFSLLRLGIAAVTLSLRGVALRSSLHRAKARAAMATIQGYCDALASFPGSSPYKRWLS